MVNFLNYTPFLLNCPYLDNTEFGIWGWASIYPCGDNLYSFYTKSGEGASIFNPDLLSLEWLALESLYGPAPSFVELADFSAGKANVSILSSSFTYAASSSAVWS